MKSNISSGTEVALNPALAETACVGFSYACNFDVPLPLLHVSMLALQERLNLDLCRRRGKWETAVHSYPSACCYKLAFLPRSLCIRRSNGNRVKERTWRRTLVSEPLVSYTSLFPTLLPNLPQSYCSLKPDSGHKFPLLFFSALSSLNTGDLVTA